VEDLLPLVYDDLRAVAAGYLAHERPDHTLQATELVHEAYLRLASVVRLDARDRAHFFTVAARAMRRILVDHARGVKTLKRAGTERRMPLDAVDLQAPRTPDEVLELHEALLVLGGREPRVADLIELRFFGGLSESEAADVLGVSRATTTRDWKFARLWLIDYLRPEGEAVGGEA
jgi:RNA polymerase sigma factor (TIGR02999 family)